MNDTIVVASLALVAVGGTAAVLARDPARQAVALGMQGLLLSVLFTVLQAPDVALSQLVVGTALTPLMILLTVRKIRTRRALPDTADRARDKHDSADEDGHP
ncbi:Na(+)/H(+) antiporter subunit B [Embleya sp. MST-111070]|uniref:Na(+)/H(+) antiporter subunit B n=1 Tax=Embleya sp. MST-111070 TaxID=3398231 RepID=UPI003F73ACBA